MRQNWVNLCTEQFPTLEWKMQEDMSRHTTFRIGGQADLFVSPSVEQAIEVVDFCRNQDIPLTILGNGSNVLVSDAGIRGVVLSFGKEASRISLEEDVMIVDAGALLSTVANTAADHSLTGLEFAAGIPGTIGGALMMNAGAYGGEMKDVVQSILVLTKDGSVEEWDKEKMDLSYRHSRMMDENAIVLRVRLVLQAGDREEIRKQMNTLRDQRVEKQPLEYPSAGSTFKRPEGYFAGKLIMDAGLRGYAIGDAAVSEKHCGFVINKGNATAAEVLTLMQNVSDKVEEQFGVPLEPEVRFIGEF